ncbi:MAG: stage V sporulation protein AC [Clostridia bacterium]|nr:stage V sporulation protein AC [Clostridia bacterium]
MVTKKEYSKMTEKAAPKSPVLRDCIMAFLIGGSICTLGQIFKNLYVYAGLDVKTAGLTATVSLIFLAVSLTAFGIFDNIARYAGAGTLVPITGFANSVAAPAIEFKSEGYVLGVGANMFKIAGPVIVYGTVASVIYGVIYWITTLF